MIGYKPSLSVAAAAAVPVEVAVAAAAGRWIPARSSLAFCAKSRKFCSFFSFSFWANFFSI